MLRVNDASSPPARDGMRACFILSSKVVEGLHMRTAYSHW
jgi:hypothetical protein